MHMTRAGNIVVTAEELDSLLEKAATRGAAHALRNLGLEGPGARKDMDDLRGLLNVLRRMGQGMWTVLGKLGAMILVCIALVAVGGPAALRHLAD
jgi:Family of unknown function (DUF6127)